MLLRGTRVTWDRPGLSRGAGLVEQSRAAHNDRTMHQVRDSRGNVFWYSEDELTEVNS